MKLLINIILFGSLFAQSIDSELNEKFIESLVDDLNRQRICYAAVERRLVIFRSYLRHMVEPCKNKLPRMSIAVNFN